MKVIKFGGSSLASATQLEKVLNIVKSDPDVALSLSLPQVNVTMKIPKSQTP